MSEKENLQSRLKAEFLGRIFATAFGAFVTVILARLLSPNDYGLFFLAISVFSMIAIATKLGIGRSAGRYIAEYKEKNPAQIPYIIGVSILYNIGSLSAVLLLLYYIYSDLIQVIGEPSLEPFLILGILFILFSTLETYVRRVLQGFEAIKFTAFLQFFHKGTRLVFSIGLVALGFGVTGALWGYILSYAFVAIIGLGFVYYKFYRRYSTANSIEEGLAQRLGEYMIPLTVTDTAHIVDENIDTVLVGVFLTPVAVGYYALGKQVSKFMMAPASSVGFTLSPTFGAKKADGNLEKASQLYESALVYSLLLYIPAAAGLFFVAELAIEIIFGLEYLGAVPVLQIFALYTIIHGITKITSDGLDYLGRARERAIARMLTVVINIILNILLINTVGVIGAAIATVISYSFYTIINIYLIQIELNLRIGYLSLQIGAILAITLLMSISVFLTIGFANGIIGLTAVIMLGVLIWLLLSIAAGLLDVKQIISFPG